MKSLPLNLAFYIETICCMAEFLNSVLKRKTRGSSSSSESGVLTPKEKRICETPAESPDEINHGARNGRRSRLEDTACPTKTQQLRKYGGRSITEIQHLGVLRKKH